jgi:hypothetical protein
MNVTTKPAFNPIIITLETQEEVDMLTDMLYNLNDYSSDIKMDFLRTLRIDLYERSSGYKP